MGAVDDLVALFARAPLVALGELHGIEQGAAFLADVVRVPRFAERVQTIVVEFGNARHQALADRYVAGETVADAHRIWCDFAGAGPWGFRAPIYPRFFATVRDVNRTLPPERRLRVLLGDPPIDWSAVRTHADAMRVTEGRDEHFASVVEREVLDRGGRALIVAGGFHLFRARPFAFVTAPNLVELLDRAAPGAMYVIVPHFGARAGLATTIETTIEAAVPSWPALVPLHGTPLGAWLAALPANAVLGGNELTRVHPDCSETAVSPYAGSPATLADLVDAYLYLGPLASYTHSRPDLTPIDDADCIELERRRMLFDPP